MYLSKKRQKTQIWHVFCLQIFYRYHSNIVMALQTLPPLCPFLDKPKLRGVRRCQTGVDREWSSELHNSPLEIYSWRHRDYVSDLANPAALQLYNVTSCVSLLLLSSKTDNSRTKRTGNSRLRSVWSPENNLKCRIMLLIWSVNGRMFTYTSPKKLF